MALGGSTAGLVRELERTLPRRPFTLRFWDGGTVLANEGEGGPVFTFRSPRAIAHVLRAPGQRDVDQFLSKEVRPALEQVAGELTARGRSAEVVDEEGGAIALRAPAEGMRDFVYGVSTTSQPLASLVPLGAGQPERRYEARTYFSSGGRGYDIMGMHRDQIIADVLVQFERYLHLVHSPDSRILHAAPEHPSGT